MSDSNGYQPPKVWTWDAGNDGEWAKLNRPVAGATHEATLTQGKHPLQLYSVATPNGQKVTILLEELLALGETGAEYDAHLVRITEGAQFSSGFVEINPNSKIPAMLDTETGARVFESGAILLYLAEKFGHFLPKELPARTEALNWLFWLQGSAPYLGGNQYTIADIATWAWYGNLVLGTLYGAGEFLQVDSYKNLQRWAQEIRERPAVKRGRMVNRVWGDPAEQLHERHDASDFELKTQDKLAPENGD